MKKRSSNLLTILWYSTLMIGFIVFLIITLCFNPEASAWPGYQLSTIAVLLFLLWLFVDGVILGTYVTTSISPEAIVFRKPWKQYAVLFKKGTSHFELKADMWTECYLFSHENSGILYFRKDKETIFIIRTDGIRKFFEVIRQRYFKTHQFINGNSLDNKHELPKNAMKRLKKSFPDRYM